MVQNSGTFWHSPTYWFIFTIPNILHTIVWLASSTVTRKNYILYFSTRRPGVCFLQQSVFCIMWAFEGCSRLRFRVTIQSRLEAIIIALQQISPFVPRNRFFCWPNLKTVRLLHGYWIKHQPLSWTELANYSLDSPQTVRCGKVGRPKYSIWGDILLHLRSSRFTLTKMAEMLLFWRWTVQHRVQEYQLQLNQLVGRFIRDLATLIGYSLVSRKHRSIVLRVKRHRFWARRQALCSLGSRREAIPVPGFSHSLVPSPCASN